MKLRIQLSQDKRFPKYMELKNTHKCNSIEDYYNKYYKQLGVKFHKETESIYYDSEVEFMPQQGQRIYCKFGYCIVDYSVYFIEKIENENDFFSISSIVIYEE